MRTAVVLLAALLAGCSEGYLDAKTYDSANALCVNNEGLLGVFVRKRFVDAKCRNGASFHIKKAGEQ